MGGGLSVLTSLSSEDLPATDPAKCKHKFCEKWGPGHFHCADCHCTITDSALMAEEDRIIDGIVDESVPEDGVNRGVSIQFLVDFATACNCWDMTTRDVRRRYVMPATRATRCRFVELPEMAGVAGRATTFVSHTWGAKFGDLVAALCDGNADRSRIVWVDIFAVRQWPSHKPDLDFSAVVKQCKSFMIVCSSQTEIAKMDPNAVTARSIHLLSPRVRAQIAFLRVWCLVELHAAITSGCALIIKVGNKTAEANGREHRVYFESNADMIFNLAQLVDIDSAEATVASDRERILGDINSSEGGVAMVNDKIRGVLMGSLLAVDQPVIQCATCNDVKALGTILASPLKYMEAVAGCGYADLLQKLIVTDGIPPPKYETDSALLCSAAGGHVACVNLLIQKGANVNALTQGGLSALFVAAVGGHTEVCSILIKHGADVSFQLENNDSPLMRAAMGGHTTCVELLLKNGADLRAKFTEDMMTATQYAAIGGHTACVKLLLSYCAAAYGDDASALREDCSTALIYASTAGYVSCVDALIKSGYCDLNFYAVDNTALIAAVRKQHIECVRLLLEAGADVNGKDKWGRTAMKFLEYSAWEECVELLKKHGAIEEQ